MIKSILWFLFAIVAALVAATLYWVQDANRFKPEIEALIAERTDIEVTINGDLAWQLWPPLTLAVRDVAARQDDISVTAARLDLRVDLSAIWQDVNAWRVTSLELTDVTAVTPESTTEVATFELRDFRPNEPAPFSADLVTTANRPDASPVAAKLDGKVVYRPGSGERPQQVEFAQTKIVSSLAEGVCDGKITERRNRPSRLPASTPDDILPLALLLSYNAAADCSLSALHLGAERFEDAAVKLAVAEGNLSAYLAIRDFLGGTLVADADVDATRKPAAWTVLPELQGVDSQRMIDWSTRKLIWAGTVGLTGTVQMSGNTQAELLASMQADADFDGGQGRLDVSKFKQQLSRIALLTNRSDKVAEWPDVVDYETMGGRLKVDGANHELAFVLDNLALDAKGTVDYLGQKVDLLANITVSEPREGSPITINEWLIDTPIPMRCRGSSYDPQCRLDNDAARQIVARALGGSDTGLRQKLEKKIEEEVPEEYKQTAKDILDLLGRALKRD